MTRVHLVIFFLFVVVFIFIVSKSQRVEKSKTFFFFYFFVHKKKCIHQQLPFYALVPVETDDNDRNYSSHHMRETRLKGSAYSSQNPRGTEQVANLRCRRHFKNNPPSVT